MRQYAPFVYLAPGERFEARAQSQIVALQTDAVEFARRQNANLHQRSILGRRHAEHGRIEFQDVERVAFKVVAIVN